MSSNWVQKGAFALLHTTQELINYLSSWHLLITCFLVPEKANSSS